MESSKDKSVDAQELLKDIKLILMDWNLNSNENIFKKIKESEKNLELLEDGAGIPEEIPIASMELEELILIEDSILKQKARANWLKIGYKNSRFFHQAILRRDMNKFVKLSWEGKIIINPVEIRMAVKEHFQTNFPRNLQRSYS